MCIWGEAEKAGGRVLVISSIRCQTEEFWFDPLDKVSQWQVFFGFGFVLHQWSENVWCSLGGSKIGSKEDEGLIK